MHRPGWRSVLCALALAGGLSGRAQAPAAAPPAPSVGSVLAQLRRAPRDPLLLQRLRDALVAAPADAASPLGLAVYALGSLWMEHTAEAESARKALLARFPDSLEAKSLAEWDGLYRPCGWCQGAGERRRADTCERCKGSRKCAACAGTGHVKLTGNRQVNCAACNGTGRCPACGGTGRAAVSCTRCNGTGRVPAPDRAFRLYRAVLKAEAE